MAIYLSASSISDFISCPQKVLYRFKKLVPEVPSKAMIRGKIVHLALEKGWKNQETALGIIREEAGKYYFPVSEISDMENYIQMFFSRFSHLFHDKDLIEYKFKFPMFDDVFLVGKIDRISKGNVYDLKTNTRIPTRLGSDVQCIIYDYAYRTLFNTDPISVSLLGLSTGRVVEYVKDELATEELFENIIPRMIKTIKNESYERLGIYNHSCFGCVYKEGCLNPKKGGEDTYVLDSPIFTE